jgi:beta-glucosidase
LQIWLQELNLGGVILLGGSCAEIAYRTQQLQQWAKTPLLISADIEEGVGQRFTGASWFPPPMTLSHITQTNPLLAQQYAQVMGKVTAEEALALGINWVLAPVVDVNNNPANPVINVRSFGDNPEIVSRLATAFIRGTKPYPILTTAKHFPGHGDTATDSHVDLPIINHDEARLKQVELVPFQQAINGGVDTIMTAHLLVKAWDEANPATLSYPILTEQLRKKMGFAGLIVTDALIMGGVAKYASTEEIAVKAIQAGADLLLMPDNPEVAINSVAKAIDSGIITETRIEQSLARLAQAKAKLFSTSASNSYPFSLISTAESQQVIEEILVKTLSWGGNLPLKPIKEGINLIIVDDLLNCDFLERQSPAVTIPESCGYQTQIFDQRNLHLVSDQNRLILLQAFIRGNPFRGSAGLTHTAQAVYQNLLNSDRLQGVILYGSPYILNWFISQLPHDLPWAFSYGQMPSAQTVTCQKLFNLSSNHDMVKGNFL